MYFLCCWPVTELVDMYTDTAGHILTTESQHPMAAPFRQLKSHSIPTQVLTENNNKTRLEMRANAQRDGRPVEYRWHSLFNAAKFG